ncbi:MAG: hypothetical protein AAGH87_01080 [Pseudomonadota bacterium]
MDDVVDIALNRVWTLVGGVLGALSTLPGLAVGFLPGPQWARAFRKLRFVEAAARRALFVMAAETPRPDVPGPGGMPAPPAPSPAPQPDLSPGLSPKMPADGAAGPGPATPQAPRFETPGPQECGPQCASPQAGRTERAAPPRPATRRPRGPRPALFALSDLIPASWIDLATGDGCGPEGPILSTGAPRPVAGLLRRIAALQAVLDDPGPAVARFLARRDRPRRHLFDKSRAPRMRPGLPPGYIRARALDWDMDVLWEIHTLAWYERAPPPLAPPAS